MGNFSVRILFKNGNPAKDVGVMIEYDGFFSGIDKKRTNSDGWIEFNNPTNKSGRIWVSGSKMGSYSLSDGKKYSFTI